MKTSASHLVALLTLALVAACASTPARPAPPALPDADARSLQADIDALVAPGVEAGDYAGVVVGVLTPVGRRVFGYGTTRLGESSPPDGRTVFEIGSISKVFTAVVAASMLREGRLRLEQPVAELLPQGVRVPSREGRAITVGDLLTHTSGLPRLPTNLDLSGLDPYSGYGADDLAAFLATYELPRRPGAAVEYSNLGLGLLGYALETSAGRPFEALVRETVAEPLGLTDTVVGLSDEQRGRLAQGYFDDAAEGLQAVPPWTFGVLAAAGALRSTADDLLTFLAANLGLVDTRLGPALRDTHVARATTDAAELSIALGWHVYTVNGRRIVWHNGGTYGAYGFVAFDESARVGVVVLANTFSLTPTLDGIGLRTLALLRRQVAPPQSP